VERCWQHGKRILAELADIDDIHAAELLRGMTIWVDAGEVEVDEDEFLWEDLIGCEVVGEAGSVLGRVVGLEAYGAQDILTVATPDGAEVAGEWMIPFIREIVLDVDLDELRIKVALPEGMDACFTPRS